MRKLDFVSRQQQRHKPACTSLQSLRWAGSEKTRLCFTRTTKAQTSLHIPTVAQMGRKGENWTLFHGNNKGTNKLSHPYSRSGGPEGRKLDFVSWEQQRHKPACTSLHLLRWARSEKTGLCFTPTTKAQTSLHIPTVAQMGQKRENWTLFHTNNKGTNQLAHPYSRSYGPEARKLDFVSREQQRHKPACTSLQSLRWARSQKTGLCFTRTTKSQTSLHIPTVAQMGQKGENWTLFHGNNKGTNQLAHPYSRSDGPEARKLDIVSRKQQRRKPACTSLQSLRWAGSEKTGLCFTRTTKAQTSLHIPTVAQMGRKRETGLCFMGTTKAQTSLHIPTVTQMGRKRENWTLFQANNKGINQLAHPYSHSDWPEARKLDFVSGEQQRHKPACTSLQSLRWAGSEKTGLCFMQTTKAQTSLHFPTVAQMGRKRENWTLFHANNKGTNQLAHPYNLTSPVCYFSSLKCPLPQPHP